MHADRREILPEELAMSLEALNTLDTTLGQTKPGQAITCTIVGDPRTDDKRQTIERLMRRDPDNKRSLRKAQNLRKRRLHVYIRGNRDWTSREKAARVVRATMGASWTMPYTPDIHADLRSVATLVNVAPAS
jgi:hypothetical protein